MPVRPCPDLLKTLGMLSGKNTSGLRFKHENITFTNIAFATHFNQIVTCTYAMPLLEVMSTQSWEIKVYLVYQCSESHCLVYTFWLYDKTCLRQQAFK